MSQNDESMRESARALEKQIFQLVNYGGYTAEYVSSLDVQTRIYVFELVEEKLKSEKDANEKEAQKIRAQSNRTKSVRKPPR